MQRIAGVVQHYPWGDPNYIAELLGLSNAEPQAEYWLGAHPRGVATLADGQRLDEMIGSNRARVLGASVSKNYSELPFLCKILAASKPLSIQCHPTKLQAEAGFKRESQDGIAIDSAERTYRDINHKPELVCALTRFEAKVGFRSAADVRTLLELLGVAELQPLLTKLEKPEPDDVLILSVLSYLLELPPTAAAELVGLVTASAQALAQTVSFAGLSPQNRLAFEWTGVINRHFPGDVGVVVALLLNHVSLEPGQAIGFEAGNLHCYLSGVGVEVMSNSDNVIRGGLTAKQVDVAELLRVVNGSPSPPVIQAPTGSQHTFTSPAEDFRLSRLLALEAERFEPRGPEIWLVSAGSFEISDSCRVLRLTAGEACFVPADNKPLILSGSGQCWRVEVGL